jgi:PHS family inorganic phosphate transporter-like MFS transporter
MIGFGYEKLIASNEGKKAFVFLYCLANFFQNFVSLSICSKG